LYKPRKVFWHLGIQRAIKDCLFGNAQWSRLRGQGRTAPMQYYTSAEAERLNNAVQGRLFHVDSSAYEIGFDNGQIFTNRVWSSGVVAIRQVSSIV
jgi:hypothetical protein